jgi:hypothetical protein
VLCSTSAVHGLVVSVLLSAPSSIRTCNKKPVGRRNTFVLQLSIIAVFLLHIEDVVVVGDQGPEPRLQFALQPLGLLYTLFSRRSHCRRQMSPCPTRRERSKQREVELYWVRKGSREFCLNADLHVTFRVLLHAANPGVDSASNRKEYKEYFLGVKAAGA